MLRQELMIVTAEKLLMLLTTKLSGLTTFPIARRLEMIGFCGRLPGLNVTKKQVLSVEMLS